MFSKHYFIRSVNRAFSLVEMLIVIALIAVVATLVIANLDTLFGGGQIDSTKTFVTQSIKTPLMAYRTAIGGYPSTNEGLNALVQPVAGKESRWRGPYVDKIPLDPWGNPYQYRNPGIHNPRGYDVWSFGPDGIDQTPDDIGNWE